MTVLSGYIYTYTDTVSIRHISAVFLWLSVAVWACLCLRQLATMVRIRFSQRKYPSSYDVPDHENLRKLAERMRVKLDKEHPFVLRIGLDNAYYDLWNGRIGLGDILVKTLERQERMALVGHELTHVKKNHFVKLFVVLLLTFIVSTFLLHREPDAVFCAVWIALFLALFPHLSRGFEYQADAGAAHETDPATTISFLKKTDTEERWNRETVTHPSTRSRIRRVEQLLKRQR